MIFVSEGRKLQMERIKNMNRMDSIHIDTVPINLESCTPSPLNLKDLTAQLNALGLNCSEASGKKLEQNVNDVIKAIQFGELSTYGVYREKKANAVLESISADRVFKIKAGSELAGLMDAAYEKKADGEWKPGPTGAYQAELLTVTYKNKATGVDNYKWLKDNCTDFPYAESEPIDTEQECSTATGLKKLFADTATSCSASTIQGIDQTSMRAIFSNTLALPDDAELSSNLVFEDSRTILLVLNYRPDPSGHGGDCDGVGALVCDYSVHIEDYKNKKKKKTKVKLHVNAYSVLYTDVALLDKHVKALKNRGLKKMLADQNIKIVTEVELFDTIPDADNDTFSKSMSCGYDSEYAYAMVFYGADLVQISKLDNTSSDAETSYSVSVTKGFATQSAVQISAETSFELGGEIAKFGMKIGFSVTLTEEWSQSKTTTISFSVPGRKKATLYQITVKCAKLQYNRATGEYGYIEYGQLLTDSYKTVDE